MSDTLTMERLLAEEHWLAGLARDLVPGGRDADEVVQETWLYALRHPPRHAKSPRGWLRAVARNAARQILRREGRRVKREERARPAPGPLDPASVVARVELRRRIAAAVLALPEPSRQAVALRYFEGLEPADIARRLSVPPSTVRSRVHRGLEELRRQLDAESPGGRETWCALLLPLLAPHSVAPALPGVIVMSLKAKLLLAAAVIVLVGLSVWQLVAPGPERIAPPEPPPPDSPMVAAASSSGTTGSTGPTEAEGEDGEPVVAASRLVAEHARIEGRVCFEGGGPAAGLFVTCHFSEAFQVAHSFVATVTATDGSFSFPAVRGAPYRVAVQSDQFGMLPTWWRQERNGFSLAREVRGGQSGVEIPIPEVSRLLVAAEDFESGAPLEIRSCTAQWMEGDRKRYSSVGTYTFGPQRLPELLPDADGVAAARPTKSRLPVLLPGRGRVEGEVTIEVTVEGYEPAAITIPAERPGPDLGEQVFRFRALGGEGWTLAVSAADTEGRAYVGSGVVRVHRGSVRVYEARFPLQDGRGVVTGLPLGADRAEVVVAGERAEVAPCPASAGAELSVHVALKPRWTIVVEPEFAGPPRMLKLTTSQARGTSLARRTREWPCTLTGFVSGEIKLRLREARDEALLAEETLTVTPGETSTWRPRIPEAR